jgi:hypothetical protein
MKSLIIRGSAVALPLFLTCVGIFAADDKKPAPKAAAPAKATPAARGPAAAGAAGRGAAPAASGRGAAPAAAGRGAAPGVAGRGGAPAAGRAGAPAGRAGAPVGRGAGPAVGGRGAAPGREVHMAGGGTARLGAHGEVREAHVRGMDIHRGPNGNRRIVAERADHSRVFAERGGRGYVQRPYMYHGREFGHRTYYVNGRAYDRFYNRYPYRGVYLDVYAPARFYPTPFYGWAYNPWVAPVPYAWGFVGNPWAVYYGGFFTPYPVYPSASFWLTDYMISTTLAAAYEAQVAAAAGAAPPPPAGPPAALTPEVKQLVAAEVQRQLALENSEAAQNARNVDPDPQSSGIARMLSDNQPHVFIAHADLDLTDATGTECFVTQGDVLQMVAPPPPAATAAQLVVLGTKGQDCRKGAAVNVQLTDLQDMQNHMRETIDSGLGEMQSKAGKGLPALPASANAAPVTAAFAAGAPPPDPDAAKEINAQVQAADSAEKEVVAQGGPSASDATPAALAPPPPPPAADVDLTGKSIDEVKQIRGEPKTSTKSGTKTIFVYPDMKVIFTNGKVTDIQ